MGMRENYVILRHPAPDDRDPDAVHRDHGCLFHDAHCTRRTVRSGTCPAPEIEKNIKAAYDLDKPLLEQYTIYIGKILRGDFGPSIKIRDFPSPN